MIYMKLVCASGLSSNLLATRLQQIAHESGNNVEVGVVNTNHIQDVVEDTDIIICGPLFGFQLSDIEKVVDGYCKIMTLSIEDFSILNIRNILDQALTLYYS